MENPDAISPGLLWKLIPFWNPSMNGLDWDLLE